MTKKELFLLVVQQKVIKENWILRGFTVFKDKRSKTYPYKIIHLDGKYGFELDGKKVTIIDSPTVDKPLYDMLENIVLKPNTFSNQLKETKTVYGNVIVNSILILHNLNDTVPFITGELSNKDIKNIEASVIKNMVKVEKGEPTPKGKVSVDNYLRFIQSLQPIESLTPYFTYAATRKNIQAPPGLDAYKKKLIKEYGDKLNDPLVFVEYENKLRAFDQEYLKDDPSNNKMVTGKIKNKTRLKMYMSYGTEVGLDPEESNIRTTNSLKERLPGDRISIAQARNATRGGSFNRGNNTQLGGVLAKLIGRILSHIQVMEDDCGTKLTLKKIVPPSNGDENQALSLYYLNSGKRTLINEANIDGLIGKELNFRSPAYCKSPEGKYCRYCLGERMYANKQSIDLVGMNLSERIVQFYLSLIHGVVNETVETDLDTAIT